jgi:hypothetical protein
MENLVPDRRFEDVFPACFRIEIIQQNFPTVPRKLIKTRPSFS